MLAKIVSENQSDWDQHLSKALFAYRTSIHEATGYTPFHVNFGRSPTLPVDVMLGTTETRKDIPIPKFVSDLNRSLAQVYSTVRQSIDVAHQRNKTRYDQHSVYTHFTIGDQVWLYVPAVKTGTTKKLASLWRGPYTVIDRINSVNYKIQLLGVHSKTLIVHHNRLKHCFCTPKPPPTNHIRSEQHPSNSLPLYSEVVAGHSPSRPGGYTSSSSTVPASTPAAPSQSTTSTRPQRTRRPPLRYEDFVAH